MATKNDTTARTEVKRWHKIDGIELTQGNLKLGSDTLILNMGSSSACPSRELGLCKVTGCCYAYKAEQAWPCVKAYRDRQASAWLNNEARVLWKAIKQIKTNYPEIKYLRFNESGDFWSQDCVDKLNRISRVLKNYGIKTYGYTARADLDFRGVSFVVRFSGYDIDGFASTCVEDTDKDVPEGFVRCPGNCRTCSICKSTKKNVAFVRH